MHDFFSVSKITCKDVGLVRAFELGEIKMDVTSVISFIGSLVFFLKFVKPVLIGIFIFVAGFCGIKIVNFAVKKLLKKTKLDEALHKFILNAIQVVLVILLIIAILSYWGIDTKSLVALVAAAGAAIALALKDSLSNVAGGIIILVTHPFKSGDYIEIDNASGIVRSIGIMFTTLHTPDNKNVSIPNGKLSTAVSVNHSVLDKRRVDARFSIDFKDDLVKAKELLLNVAESCPDVLKYPEPTTGVNSIEGGRVSIDLMVWCATDNYLNVRYFLEENVKIAFDNAGFK